MSEPKQTELTPEQLEAQEYAELEELESDDGFTNDDEVAGVFNWKWREVIEGLMNRLPIYKAYAKAYEIDISGEGGKRQAEANGSRLMRNDKFRALWQRVLTEKGFNDETADWSLMDLITNPSTENQVRVRAIAHYNELRGRIVRKAAMTDEKGNSLFDAEGFTMKVVRNAASDENKDTN